MNTWLLRRVQKHILAEPKRLRMTNWVVSTTNNAYPAEGGKFLFGEEERNSWGEPGTQPVPKCGTVGCIGGWAAILSKSAGESGARLLGLNEYAAERLFYVTSWPVALKNRYVKAKTAATRAKIVAKRIDHFIATKGTE